MKAQNRILLFLVCATMELCYLYAGTTFATTAIFHQAFPFPEAVGTFFLAALLTLIAEGRGWRVIFVLGFQAIGFVPSLWRMMSIFDSWSDAFASQFWFADYFSGQVSAVEYFVFVLVIVWVLVFWAGGAGFASRQKVYSTICARFDRGLAVFFALFLVKFYLQLVQGITLDESLSGFFIFPFLLFSLLAIGLVRNQSATERDFIPGYKMLGVMFGFIVVIFLAGLGLIFFCLPYLTLAAEKGNDLLNIVSQPFITVFFAILTWLFGDDFSSNNLTPPGKKTEVSTIQWSLPWWTEVLGRIIAVGVMLIVVVVLLAVVGGMLYSIFRWLLSKTAINPEKSRLRDLFASLADFFHALRRKSRGTKQRGAARLYAALQTWGRNSGAPHALAETPGEYGLRLQHRFPTLAEEIASIVEAFNRQVYGEIVLSEQQLTHAHLAWRALTSPAHWRMRLKAWFNRVR